MCIRCWLWCGVAVGTQRKITQPVAAAAAVLLWASLMLYLGNYCLRSPLVRQRAHPALEHCYLLQEGLVPHLALAAQVVQEQQHQGYVVRLQHLAVLVVLQQLPGNLAVVVADHRMEMVVLAVRLGIYQPMTAPEAVGGVELAELLLVGLALEVVVDYMQEQQSQRQIAHLVEEERLAQVVRHPAQPLAGEVVLAHLVGGMAH